MSIVKIKLIDSLDQEFIFPKTFELRSDPSAWRSQPLDLAFTHGAKDVSDGMVSKKFIEISGKIWASSDADFNTKWDALAVHLIKKNVRIQNMDRQIYLKKVVGISKTYPSKVSYHHGEVSITFLAADPFWYSKTEQEENQEITSSPKLFEFEIGGNMETWPIITIENNADNFSFVLMNKTDGDRFSTVDDAGAGSGTTIVIDTKAGTIKRGATNIISAFSGLWLRLLGGRTNEFSYIGANCDIKMEYFEAWI